MFTIKTFIMQRKFHYTLMAMWLTVFALTADSCFAHVRGNGKVVKEERNISGFDAITVSNGIDVLISQDTFEKVVVEADENIQKILKTEVKEGKLKIYLDESVYNAEKMKVWVTLKQLKSLEGNSGADVRSTGRINAESLKINASSGSDVKMEVNCGQLMLDSSSGSDLTVSGIAALLKASASSGSDLNAAKLVAEKGEVSASSGSDLDATVTKEVKAHASSGADVTVYGKPAIRDTNRSSGGEVNYR
jgi:hypothetical protein